MKIPVPDLDLEATMESGQIFGYQKISQNHYELALNGHLIEVIQKDKMLFLGRSKLKNLYFKKFFDLEKDLSPLYRLLKKEPCLSPLLRFKGLRIARQNPWETMGSFIISSNNNVKRIQKIWWNLALTVGETPFRFPSPLEIAQTSEADLLKTGLGYRAGYIKKTAEMIVHMPDFFCSIDQKDYLTGREMLMEFPGVGKKVADCILLFGFGKYEAFPVDVWIHRLVHRLYPTENFKSDESIRFFAWKRWRNWAGYVQQYLYYGGRMGVI